jgi:seryl-tRNA synthetase
MIDIKILRNNPELIRESIILRNLKIDLDVLITLDAERLSKRQALEELQTLRNRVSKEIPTITDVTLRTAKITEMK